MSKLSAVIITLNEELYIEQCIKSVAKVTDEIVVIDSFSNDKTKEICLSHGVRFIEHPFKGFRDQKNYALTQTSYDYILSLDADEALSPELEKSILNAKQDFRYDGYKFNRLNNCSGRWMFHTSLYPERKIRIFNKKKAHWGGYNIHEKIILDNPQSVKFLKGNLYHWFYDSYEESVDKMNKYSTLLAKEYFRQGIKANAKRLIIHPLWRFLYSYFIKGGFIDGYDGFVVSKILATTCFLKYIKLRKICLEAKQSRTKTNQCTSIPNTNQNGYNEEYISPISIGFDAKRAFFNSSGLGNYSRNLLSSLAIAFPENSYSLFTPKTNNRIVFEDEGQFNLIRPNLVVSKLLGSLWRRKYMISNIKQQKLAIFHGLSQELPIGIERTGVKSVVTIHDLIFIRYPKYYNRIDAKIYYRKLVHACRVSDHIVAISKQTQNDIVTFLNISPDKISVIYQSCNPYFWNKYSKEYFHEVRVKYNLPERYLLYVGTIEERKNLISIVKAMHILNIDIPLVVIGRKIADYHKKVLTYITTHKLGNIIFPDRVLNIELPVIYQNAECFIYPSFFEGFGIPLLEALVSRTPVITSQIGCFAEAAGPGSLYVDPCKVEEIGEAICKVINNKELSEKMITIGADYANNFKDIEIAHAYMKLYHSLLR